MTKNSPVPGEWLPENAAQAALDAQRIIRVSGRDAAELLQGQLSNDVNALAAAAAQFSSHNSPKGRVLAFLRVLKSGDDYWLAVDAGIADAFLQRLKMFVLRSKVTVEAMDDFSGSAIVGPGAADALTAAGWPIPETGKGAVHGDCVVFALPGPLPRVEVFGPRETLPTLEIAQATGEDLERWDVLFHLPRINDANRDRHVAQHLDLDELGAINFKKGCYTGQEIIARMKYLGKVKKRAAVFLGDGARAGDAVRTKDGKAAGDVVNVAPADDRQLILSVVNLDVRDDALTVNGQPLQRLA